MRLKSLLVVLLLSAGTPALVVGQEANLSAEQVEKRGQLVDRLYSLEEFQQRLVRAIDNNLDLVERAQDKVFMQAISAAGRETALSSYGQSVSEALATLSGAQIDSLLTLLESPVGPLVVKLFNADNTYVEAALQAYVNSLTDIGLTAQTAFDSLLYNRQWSHDLREVMDGDYLDVASPTQTVSVRRRRDRQTEILGQDTFNFTIRWVTNSKYGLSDVAGNPLELGDELLINIYEIEGDEFRYIWRNPDGSYAKDYFTKTAYATYAQEITTFQWALTEQYLHPDTSPLPEDRIAGFAAAGGHKFFPTDEAYRVTARLTRDTSGQEWTMPTSNGSEKTLDVYGTANFTLAGEERQLTLYQSRADGAEERPLLFLPFRDATSSTLTYGGGRYLDLSLPTGDEMTIDFNKAYHPYCAYAEGYACPVPPEVNTLPIVLEAGIRLTP